MFYTPLYILFSNINVDVSLDNLALSSPVVSSMYLNIIMIASVGIIGYIILQSIHLNKQPPLITVFSIIGAILVILILFCQSSDAIIKA
ncbi:DUF6688 domain-containing protein [Thomasclavelia ramosa]|uniref:DUF6688 domain-containing protein n=1 Tax=Thomasclavelia TaxID=3025755 RepID=UPI003AB967E5